MLRALGKTCFAAAYNVTHAARRFGAGPAPVTGAPFIVCYHRVVENFDRSSRTAIPSMLISTAMFEQHIDWLAKRFSIVSLDDIGLHMEADRGFRKPAAAITFDDGYSDVFHHAYPILKRKGIPAALFVVTGLVGTGTPQIFDRLYLLLRLLDSHGLPVAETVASHVKSLDIRSLRPNRNGAVEDQPYRLMTILLNALPRQEVEKTIAALESRIPCNRMLLDEFAPLTWDMIETMHRNGMTIGSHTKSHTLLTAEPLKTAQMELTESKKALESRLNSDVRHFAYPDGRFNPSVVRAVSGAGYRFAYSICHQRDRNLPLLTIPRKVLWERSCLNALGRFSSSIMNCQVHGAFDPKDRCEHDHSTIRIEDMNGTIN